MDPFKYDRHIFQRLILSAGGLVGQLFLRLYKLGRWAIKGVIIRLGEFALARPQIKNCCLRMLACSPKLYLRLRGIINPTEQEPAVYEIAVNCLSPRGRGIYEELLKADGMRGKHAYRR